MGSQEVGKDFCQGLWGWGGRVTERTTAIWGEDPYHLPGVGQVLALHCTKKQSLPTEGTPRAEAGEEAGGKGGAHTTTGYIVFLNPGLPKDSQPHLQ